MSLPNKTYALLGLSLLAQQAQADIYHYNDILVGDRAASMGGAYTAIADDASGSYYNPAGIVYSVTGNIQGSMNALHQSITTYKNALGGKYDWVRKSSVLVPSFFGIIKPLGVGTLGFSWAVPDSVLEDQDQIFYDVNTAVEQFTINVNNEGKTYVYGPSYAIKFSDQFALGITLYGHYRTQKLINNQIVEFKKTNESDPLDYEWQNAYFQLEEHGFKPMVGMIWSPMKKLSLGFTWSKTWVVYSDTRAQIACRGAENLPNGSQYGEGSVCQEGLYDLYIAKSTYRRPLPHQFKLGMAYFANDRLLFSADGAYYTVGDVGTNPVINIALGLEYYMTGKQVLRMGYNSNFANSPVINHQLTDQAEHVDLHTLGMAFTNFSRNSSFTLGVNFSYGEGEAQLFGGETLVQEVEAMTYTVYITASTFTF